MKTIFLFTFLVLGFLSTPNSFSQTKNEDKEKAGKLIVQLKDGALLVQLLSKQITIDDYIRDGYTSKAEQIKQNQSRDNLKIITAFKESFRFCKVYFFYSEQIEAIVEKRLNDVIFVDEKGQNDPDIKVDASFYMIFSYSTDTDKQNKSLLNANALTIKDEGNNAITRYFPYYLNLPKNLPKYKKVKKKVYNYDRELRIFYYKQPVQEQ
jgi:regulator of replication initiation timing/uncharacterized protein (UPF0297 family)